MERLIGKTIDTLDSGEYILIECKINRIAGDDTIIEAYRCQIDTICGAATAVLKDCTVNEIKGSCLITNATGCDIRNIRDSVKVNKICKCEVYVITDTACVIEINDSSVNTIQSEATISCITKECDIGDIKGNVRVETIENRCSIMCISENTYVDRIKNSRVTSLHTVGTIKSISGCYIVRILGFTNVYDIESNSEIRKIEDNAIVNNIINSKVDYIKGNSYIGTADNITVKCICGKATIGSITSSEVIDINEYAIISSISNCKVGAIADTAYVRNETNIAKVVKDDVDNVYVVGIVLGTNREDKHRHAVIKLLKQLPNIDSIEEVANGVVVSFSGSIMDILKDMDKYNYITIGM